MYKLRGDYKKKKKKAGGWRGRASAAVPFTGRNFLRVAAGLREAESDSAVAAAPAAAVCEGNNFALYQRGQGEREVEEEEEGGEGSPILPSPQPFLRTPPRPLGAACPSEGSSPAAHPQAGQLAPWRRSRAPPLQPKWSRDTSPHTHTLPAPPPETPGSLLLSSSFS